MRKAMSVTTKKPVPVNPLLSAEMLTELLIKHYDFHEGFFSLAVEFQIGTGTVGPSPEKRSPGVMIGIAKIGLVETDEATPLSVNASISNPAKKTRKKVTKKENIVNEE